MILTETDLKSLGLPLGPFRKLTIALQKKKNEISADADGLDESGKCFGMFDFWSIMEH